MKVGTYVEIQLVGGPMDGRIIRVHPETVPTVWPVQLESGEWSMYVPTGGLHAVSLRPVYVLEGSEEDPLTEGETT